MPADLASRQTALATRQAVALHEASTATQAETSSGIAELLAELGLKAQRLASGHSITRGA